MKALLIFLLLPVLLISQSIDGIPVDIGTTVDGVELTAGMSVGGVDLGLSGGSPTEKYIILDGTNEYLEFDGLTLDEFDATGFYMAMWVNITAYPGDFDNMVGSSVTDQVMFAVDNDGDLLLYAEDDGENVKAIYNEPGPVGTGWHHIVWQIGCSDNTALSIYVDGSLYDSGTFSGWTGWNNTAELLIGSNGGAFIAPFYYSQIAIFDTPLTAGNVTTLYGSGDETAPVDPTVLGTCITLITFNTVSDISAIPDEEGSNDVIGVNCELGDIVEF